MTRSIIFVKILAVLMFIMFASPAMANDDLSSSRLGSFNIAPKLGYAFYEGLRGDSNLSSRHSMLVQLDIDLGGEGSGFIFAPYYAMETVDIGVKKKMHALGANFGMRYAFGIGHAFPYIGFQTKIGYIFENSGLNIDHGIEIYGRIPIGLTYYILEDLGLVIETCIGYGTTALTGSGYSLTWGHGLYTDVALGIRWP